MAVVMASLEVGSDVNFPITAEEYRKFSDFFYRKVGVHFADGKRYFVDRRIADRARINNCATFAEYFSLLRFDASEREVQQLINLLTVNETYFFRESYQLDALIEFVLPEIARCKQPNDTIRIWSLPCSTGEEPYSIAISVLERWARSDEYRIEIIGSDIDTRVLQEAADGIYGERSLQNVGAQLRSRYFRSLGRNNHQIIPELRESIDFSRVNLSSKADVSRFRNIDVVFCRNLLIYFDDISRREAVAAIYESLNPGGFLFLGHSESMSRMSSLFTSRRFGNSLAFQRPLEGR